MMKFYADLFALTADSISEKSIKRLRWLTIGSLSIIPLTVFLILYGLPKGYSAIAFFIAYVAAAIFTVTVLLARIVNRVWSPDKYLDEWEKDLKRKSMTLAFMVVIYVAIGLGISLEVLGGFVAPLVAESSRKLSYLVIFLLLSTGFYTQIFKQISLIEPMDEDELDGQGYIVTSARSILGIITLGIVVLLSGVFVLGFYNGHRNHDIEHAAAQEVCGDIDVDTHKKTKAAIDVVCEGSEDVIRLDLETLKPI